MDDATDQERAAAHDNVKWTMNRYKGTVNAPEFPTNLDWLNTAGPLTLRSLRGKVVLLDFWTFCCVNCHHNLAPLRSLRRQFSSELAIIGVHSAKFTAEKLTANIHQAVLRHGIQHPVINDAGYEIWSDYAIRAWPTQVLIDPSGKIVLVESGEIDNDVLAPRIRELILDAESKGLLDRGPLEWGDRAVEQTARTLRFPSKVLLIPDNRLMIADAGHHRLLEIQLQPGGTEGTISRIIGTGTAALVDGPAASACFDDPHGMSYWRGKVYVADTGNHAVRRVDLDTGQVSTIAGNGKKAAGRVPSGTIASETELRSPWAVWADGESLLVALAGSHQIAVIVGEEQIGPYAGSGEEALVDGARPAARFNQPSDLAEGADHLFVADAEASAIRAISIVGDGEVTTVVGQGLFQFGDQDGVGSEVRLQHPTGIAFHEGLIYIADSYNHKIKSLDPRTGRTETLIGNGNAGLVDGPFRQAELFQPEGLSIESGLLYIADTNNHSIRVANLDLKIISTLTIG